MTSRDELIRQIVATYPQLMDGEYETGLATYAVIYKDKSSNIINRNQVCHATLSYREFGALEVITSFPVADEFLYLAFFDFMKNTLYSQFSDKISLIKSEDGQYLISLDATLPANILFNICICSRIGVEFPECLQAWAKYIWRGVHPCLALQLSKSLFDIDKEGALDNIVNSVGSDKHHWPVDLACDLERLILGNPIDSRWSYAESPSSVTPTNCVWGSGTKLRQLRNKSLREFCDILKNENPIYENLLQPS